MNFKNWPLICVLILLSLVYTQPTRAHTELTTAHPKQGSTLTHPPTEIRLQFSEAINAGSTFILFAEGFRQIPTDVVLNPDQPTDLITQIEQPLAAGQYTVQWLVISQDKHQLSGSYHFQIIGDVNMELVAEGSAVNLPGIVAWIMIAIALATPGIVWRWAKNSK